MPDYLQRLIVPVHRAGWPFIAGGLAVTVLLGLLFAPLFWLGLLVTAWMAYFFRDRRGSRPGRRSRGQPGGRRDPGDHRAPAAARAGARRGARTCISVFLNIFDVHVNRAPVGGRITRLAYHPGQFLNAAQDKASEDNERQSFRIETRRATSSASSRSRG